MGVVSLWTAQKVFLNTVAQLTIFVSIHREKRWVWTLPRKSITVLFPDQPIRRNTPLRRGTGPKPVRISGSEYLASGFCPPNADDSYALREHEDRVASPNFVHVDRIPELFPRSCIPSVTHAFLRLRGPFSVRVADEEPASGVEQLA